MKLFSKSAACICALTIAASAMTSLSVSAEQSGETAAAVTQESSKAENTNVKYGKVTAVNGSNLTVALGEFTKKEKNADESAVREKEKLSDDTASADEQQTEKTGRKHKGRKGKSDHHGSFTENGTSVTVTVTDTLSISKKGEEASVSDISEGDTLKLVYNENGKLESVKLIKGHKHGSKKTDSSTESLRAKKGSKSTEQTPEV